MVTTKSSPKWAIDDVWILLDSVTHKSSMTERLWAELNRVTVQQEKEHRAFGASLKQSMKGRVSVETAARYFAAIAPFRQLVSPANWTEACDVRRDWAIGYALAELFGQFIRCGHAPAPTIWSLILQEKYITSIERLKEIDYARDLTGR